MDNEVGLYVNFFVILGEMSTLQTEIHQINLCIE